MIITGYTVVKLVVLIADIGEFITRDRWLNEKLMTLWEWIKSHILADILFYPRHYSPGPRKRHYTKRFVTPRKKGFITRACFKTTKFRLQVFEVCAGNQSPDSSQAQQSNPSMRFDSDSFLIGIDNHASRSISNNIRHFVTPLSKPPKTRQRIRGIGNQMLSVTGEGTVLWKWEDDDGDVHQHYIDGVLYVPEASFCILSPQHWSQQANDNNPNPNGTWCATYADKCVLHWKQQKFKRTVYLDQATNTARFHSAAGAVKYRVFAAAQDAFNNIEVNEHVVYQALHDDGVPHVIPDEVDDHQDVDRSSPNEAQSPRARSVDEVREENLSDFFDVSDIPAIVPNVITDEEEDNLSAISPQADLLRWHYRLGHASFRRIKLLALLGILPRRLAFVQQPKCAGCIFGALTKRPWRTKATPNQRNKIFQANAPGDCVSVDQLESSLLGFIAIFKGQPTKRRYRAATVFVDHKSRLSYVHLQQQLTSSETLQAKHAFEAFARNNGVTIKHYHADNGRFADLQFMQDVAKQGQEISFCGVNAHFQNGIAEKRIRDLQESARKQLLHAKARWPSAVELSLWPYALRSANHLRNTLPDDEDGSSPLERFARSEVAPKLKENHTFGCPVYALQNRLQAGNRIPKWNPRARIGLNLGPSPRHASSVSLVLNLQTGLVSPQYHVTYDDFFETVRPSARNEPTISSWQSLAGFRHSRDIPTSEGVPSATSDSTTTRNNLGPLSSEEPASVNDDRSNIGLPSSEEPASVNDDLSDNQPPDQNQASVPVQSDHTLTQDQPSTQATAPFLPSLFRTRTRTIRRPERFVEAYSSYYEAMHEDDYLLQDQLQDPIAFMNSTSPDVLYFDQAMRQPDRDEFIKAIISEVNDHIDRKHWELIPRNQVPKNEKVLSSVWSMKRKRDIKTQQVYKYKARLNVHGGQQEYAVNYFETYAPVVTWPSVRTLLTLSIIHRWCTRQIDFVLAYPQAPIEFDIYMELPKGIETKYGNGRTHVLKLRRNVYGQKQAGRIWNQHLVKGLNSIGFKQSNSDDCVFFRGTTIFAFFVDDGLFFSPRSTEIDKAINDLKNAGFDIEDKGTLKDYLGVNVEYLRNGKIKLSQPHLIDQIIQDTGLTSRSRTQSTPAPSTKILHRDQFGEPFDDSFHYRSLIGKLNFLEKTTRPDIAYATHQCARFCEDPKQSHAKAVIHLVQYLNGTRDKGIILDPNRLKSLECYADADFSGNWNRTTAADDPSTAKSRTGFVIMLADCPLFWSSKLQTQIALSTTEAEYIALSQALRDLIPIMNLLLELKEHGLSIVSEVPRVHCKAFEDNSGALELARLPKLRPRTKHINLVYHHFRQHVRDGLISIFPIDTADQLGDIFTKPLPQNAFLKHRKKLLRF